MTRFDQPGEALAHLVPLGTPQVLIPLMVLVERVRISIRPLTLAVRLTANMVAGHLLLGLIGDRFNFSLAIFPLLVPQTLLVVIELAVAAIQAYVFIILLALYSKEVFLFSLMNIPFTWVRLS